MSSTGLVGLADTATRATSSANLGPRSHADCLLFASDRIRGGCSFQRKNNSRHHDRRRPPGGLTRKTTGRGALLAIRRPAGGRRRAAAGRGRCGLIGARRVPLEFCPRSRWRRRTRCDEVRVGMATMVEQAEVGVTVGVDTHADVHVAAARAPTRHDQCAEHRCRARSAHGLGPGVRSRRPGRRRGYPAATGSD